MWKQTLTQKPFESTYKFTHVVIHKVRMIADTRASLAATQHRIDRAIRKTERGQKRARKTLRKIDQLEEEPL